MLAKAFLRELKKQGADDVVISTEHSLHTQLKYVNNDIVAPKIWEEEEYGVFIVVDKRILSTRIQHLSMASLPRRAKDLMVFAKRMSPKNDHQGIASGPFTYKTISQTYDKKILSLDEQGPRLVKEAIGQAISSGAVRSSGVFEYGQTNTSLLTSENVEASSKGTFLYFSMRALADEHASSHQVRAARVLKGFSMIEAAKEAGRTAKASLNPTKGKSGSYDVVFEPLAAANLLDHVGNAASLFSVETGMSFLKGKQNAKVASTPFTLYDDGRLPNGHNSVAFDEEGRPTGTTPLIVDGIMKTYLSNTSLAKKHHQRPTGNAGLVSPEPWNLVVKKGKYNKEQLLERINNGLLITNLWYTRFQNYLTGQFSTIPRDAIFVVKDGELHHPIKGIRVSDALPRMLNAIMALTQERHQVISWETEHPVLTPEIAITDVCISTSTA
ncbi:MAG: TldD/PmbA family protein [Nanoarchaeota archaeon]